MARVPDVFRHAPHFFLVLISYGIEDLKATIMIGATVLLATIVRFWQETGSNKAAEKLKAMVHAAVTVLRRNISEDAAPVFRRYLGVEIRTRPVHRREAPIHDLVPGDIVPLSAGDAIPCRSPRAFGQGPVHKPDGDDGRVATD